jgi:aminoglycoside phosphotransferase family enzyme/predicted kinase
MDDQSAVIGLLSTHAEAVRETHISYVFLHKDRAYKLKKAVVLPFVDQSSLARRKALCEAELRINRRTAPALYVGMRGVDGDRFDPPTPLDYVVEMRRFDEAGLVSNLVRDGALPPLLLRELADEIAAFHERAELVPRDGAAALRGVMAGNEERLRTFAPPLAGDDVEALIEATRRAFDKCADQLTARGGTKIRRCHGDLHLGNIVRLSGHPVLFDAIEFSDAFSCIDVAYDLAFLLMDLCAQHAQAGANTVFNRYVDRTGDDAALGVLPLFLSVRAAIRAHVSVAQRRDGAGYLRLARDMLVRRPPGLMAVGGLSGSGKSTLAAALAPGFGQSPGARVLRSDVVRKQLFGVAPEVRLPVAAYSAQWSAQTYRTLLAQAETALRAGYSVILDAAFLGKPERVAAAEVAAKHGVPFSGFWLDAPEAFLAARIAARTHDASDATAEVMRAQASRITGRLDWRRLDATASLAELVREASIPYR